MAQSFDPLQKSRQNRRSYARREALSAIGFAPAQIDLFIYLFIYYFPTIKITQALHYTKMWRGDLRKPQGLYEEAPSLQ